MPALTVGLCLVVLLYPDAQILFLDPFHRGRLFHPAMLFVALTTLVPIMALPAMAQSSEDRASWIIRLSVISGAELSRAVRRIFWILFALPFLLVLICSYIAYGAEPLSIAAHLFMLGLLIEVTACGFFVALPALPFSRPIADENIAMVFTAAFLLAYVSAGLLGALVIHIIYRYWWSYSIAIIALLFLRRYLVRRQQKRKLPAD